MHGRQQPLFIRSTKCWRAVNGLGRRPLFLPLCRCLCRGWAAAAVEAAAADVAATGSGGESPLAEAAQQLVQPAVSTPLAAAVGLLKSRRGSNGRNCRRRFGMGGDEGWRSAGHWRSSGRRRDSHTPGRRSSVRRNGGGCCAWRDRSVGRCWAGRCSWISCGGCGRRSRRQVRCWARHRSDGCTSCCWCESCIG